MKNHLLVIVALFLSSMAIQAQKSNQALGSELKNSKIKLTYDAGSGTSKLMGVAENFSDSEAKNAKVTAMNFAVGFFYPGQILERAPEQVLLTFWVMSKKPQFAENHSMTILAYGETIEIGDCRYSAKPREDMEYLNFNIDRGTLARIASHANVRFKLGNASFTFSRDQLRMLADLVKASDPSSH